MLPLVFTATIGTKALYTFFYWYKTAQNASLFYIDAFDAHYHYELSESIVMLLEKMQNTQFILTSHNTNLLSNRIMRPDCYFILTGEKRSSLADATPYALYQVMFAQGHTESMDILQVLKERKPVEEKKIFDEKYSDILLVFDMDPQDSQFSAERLKCMADCFCGSTDVGKLYINYPMVEAFYHMASIPDPGFMERTATLEELQNRAYKARVKQENCNHDYTNARERCCGSAQHVFLFYR